MAKTKTTKAVKNKYSFVLLLNGKEYKAEGNDLKEMLLNIKPEFYKTKGYLCIKNSEKEVRRIMNIPQLKRLFGFGGTNTQNIAVECTAKFLKMMLGEK